MTQFFLAAPTGILGFLSFPKYALDFCVWFARLCAGMTLLGALSRWRWLSPLTSASQS